jgi:hypothetical protein
MADVAKRRGYSTTENLNSTHVRFVTRIWSYSRGEKNRDFFFFLGFLSLGPKLVFKYTLCESLLEKLFSPRERRIDWMLLKNAFEL